MNLEILAKETLEGRRDYAKFVENTLSELKKTRPPIRSCLEGFSILYNSFRNLEAEMLNDAPDRAALLAELGTLSATCLRFAEDILRVKLQAPPD